MMEREEIENKIREVAYKLYVESGCIPGRDLDNWLEAEKIVKEQLQNEKLKSEEIVEVSDSETEQKTTKKRVCKKTSKSQSKSKSKNKKS